MEDLRGGNDHPPLSGPMLGFDHYSVAADEVQAGGVIVVNPTCGLESYAHQFRHIRTRFIDIGEIDRPVAVQGTGSADILYRAS